MIYLTYIVNDEISESRAKIIEHILQKRQVSFYSYGVYQPDWIEYRSKEWYDSVVYMLDKSSALLIVGDQLDPDMMFTIGYMFARNKPILTVKFDNHRSYNIINYTSTEIHIDQLHEFKF